jgi:MFS family permease
MTGVQQAPKPLAPTPPTASPTPAPTRRRLPAGLSAFRHRNFRLFYAGMLVSLVGTWMQQVGQSWLVLQLTNDPLWLGLVAAAQFTPVLFLGLFGGIVADAVSKKKALIVTAIAAGVLAFALGVLVITEQVQVWHVFVLALLLGVVNSFDMPVRQAFVVEMVGRDDIANAVALNSANFNVTRIIGPAIAGLSIAAIGIHPLFFINSISYVAVVIGLLLMRDSELRIPDRMVIERNWRSVIDRLVEGLRYTRGDPQIFLAIAVLGVVATFALNFSVLIPLVARDVLHGNADTYGFLMSATGIGSLLSALSIAFGARPTMVRLLVGAGVIGVSMIGLGLSTWLPLSLGLMFLAGWGTISMAATCNTLIQLRVPDVLRGRVASVYTTVFAGATPFGGVFSGTLAALGGPPAALVVGGAVAVLAAFVGFLRIPGGSAMDRLPALTRLSPERRR